MKIFVTGGSGYIGSAVSLALLARGHEVTAVVRAGSEVSSLRRAGAALVTGDLASLPSLLPVIEAHEVFVHMAASYEGGGVELDRIAVDTFTGVTAPGTHFLYTSGVWVFGDTGDETATEDSPRTPAAISSWRPAHEDAVLGAASDARAVTVLRPGCVYGGKQSLFRDWFVAVTGDAPIALIDGGRNRWSLISLDDLAECYVAAVEKRVGGVLHVTEDSHESLRALAEALIRHTGSKSQIESPSLVSMSEKLGPAYAAALALDQQVSSRKSQLRTGWLPQRTFLSSLAEQWQEWRRVQNLDGRPDSE